MPTDLPDQLAVAQHREAAKMGVEEFLGSGEDTGVGLDVLYLAAHVLLDLASPVLVISGIVNNLHTIFHRQYADQLSRFIENRCTMDAIPREVRERYWIAEQQILLYKQECERRKTSEEFH